MDMHARASAFRQLHDRPGAFVVPNPWDAGIGEAARLRSASRRSPRPAPDSPSRSAGRDAMAAIGRDETLANVACHRRGHEPAGAADLENGFGDDPQACAETIRLVAAAGARRRLDRGRDGRAGRSDLPVRAGRRARARRGGGGTRAAVPLRPHGARRELPHRPARPRRHDPPAARRSPHAGADVLYAPGLTTREAIASVVRAVAPKPVNVAHGPLRRDVLARRARRISASSA